jgi:hypothetical protein
MFQWLIMIFTNPARWPARHAALLRRSYAKAKSDLAGLDLLAPPFGSSQKVEKKDGQVKERGNTACLQRK